ncbi:hypothetical protein Kpol_1035p30 [Vanderwaltozyma polyspora DSM 70294]|uniref:Aminotransferase class I/classII large domain-containing protein n=1 Tax=Vanderwaltozyma polyspora (strain ATCC 22028 / DSM 70294 / BCRC 21397 / CBS 2163 / NBRC 10782 / NRRL Y-8283 / UCD 57-17) TaxID=436907 RepID=A7TKJ5_VANPO|nr:uncharacterized protein Kpol_1035p30 [Vanderwaltozyma polyspora DSM 70294]EDO17217.1 hypothetical protein Kpol_1035p30 [Vanderwaltozyma polyspora DSM 70294]
MSIKLDYSTLEERYSKFLSKRCKDRTFAQFWDNDGDVPDDLIELTAGMPNPKLFPINSIDLHISDKPQLGDETLKKVSMSLNSPAELPMARTFQYSETVGLPPLINFSRNIIKKANNPAYDNWDVILGNGSSDSMFKLFETICDENTTVMMEEFTFSPVIYNIKATGAAHIPIKMELSENPEKQGIDVDYMQTLLENWDSSEHKHLPKPTVLYTIATGQNPTGMTLSMEKRRKIYKICQKHDIIIVEDDPYGYLYLPKYDKSKPDKNPYLDDENLTVDKYINDYLVKSFMTIDTDARVVRLETFSKVYAPGLRLSFMAANKFIIDKVLTYTEITTRAPSGTSQAILYTTIKELAKPYEDKFENVDYAQLEGWFHWIMKVAAEYTHRRNVMFKALYGTEAFKKGYLEVLEPSAGMFINVKVNLDGIKKTEGKDVITVMNELNRSFLSSGVKVILGYKMAVDKEFSKDNANFIRITVAFAENDEILDKASKRIGDGIMKYIEN